MTGPDDPTVRVDVRAAQQQYAREVGAALADLPPDEAAEMRADLDGHLGDVGAELGAAPTYDQLVARLGPPARYAAELRTAAGFGPPLTGGRTGPGGGTRFLTWWLRLIAAGLVLGVLASVVGVSAYALVVTGAFVSIVLIVTAAFASLGLRRAPWDAAYTAHVLALPDAVRVRGWYAAARERRIAGPVLRYVAALRPAWWLVRAGVAAWLAGSLLGGGLAVVVFFLVAAPVSVWIGHRNRVDAGWNALTVPGNVLTVLVFLAAVGF